MAGAPKLCFCASPRMRVTNVHLVRIASWPNSHPTRKDVEFGGLGFRVTSSMSHGLDDVSSRSIGLAAWVFTASSSVARHAIGALGHGQQKGIPQENAKYVTDLDI